MPILSVISNSGLTAYSNRLKNIISAYSNGGYSGKDPLWHATTAWITSASSNSNKLFFDALLVGAGGGGGSGGGHGGGAGGGYLYASGIEIGYGSYLDIEVGMARPTEAGRTGPKGSESFIDAGNLFAYGGGGGSGDGPAYGDGYQGPGTVGYYTRNTGKGSRGGGAPAGDYSPWQGNNGGDARFANPDYIGGGGGGAGSAGSSPDPNSPSLSTQAGAGGGGITVGFPGFGNFDISGGGGGAHSSTTGAGRAPGNGGGGSGGFYVQPYDGGNGTGPSWSNRLGANASTWGAGGGASTGQIWGGRGGNGMVFLRYPNYHANATVYVYPDEGSNRDGCIAEYADTGGYRCWKFTPQTGAVTPDGRNYYYAKARLYLPHRLNHVTDQATGLTGRPHRLNNRSADGGDANALPIPSTFGPFSTNGWGISLNEDSPINSSNHFSWLTYPNNLSDFADIGTGDFMLQAYVKKTGYYSDSQTGRSQPILFLEYANGNTMEFGNFVDPGVNNFGYMGVAQTGTPITGTTAASDKVWYKVRIQRSVGIVSVFVNDVRIGIGSDTTNYSGTPTKVWIGWNGYASSWDVRAFVGQISGLIFRKGTTNVFDLRNSNNFRNKLNPQTVIPRNQNRNGTGGDTPRPSCFITGSLDTYSTTNFPSSDKISSIYWNGSATVNTSITWDGYYPNGVTNTQPTYVFCANTSNFCVDGWIYPTTNADSQLVFTMGSGSEDYFSIYVNTSSRRLTFVASRATPSTVLYGPSGGVISNTWTHFAVQRENNVLKVYTNGQAGDIQSDTGAAIYNFNDATLYPTISGRHNLEGGRFFNGYTTQLRYSRFARYGTTYTVPTTPVSADSASLFVNGYAGGSAGPPMWDATQKNQFTFAGSPGTVTVGNQSDNVGTVRFSSSSQFPNQYNDNGSLYSDGNGHYVRFVGPQNQRNFAFGTADFCVDGWWTIDYVPSRKTLIDFRELTSDVAFALKIDTSNRILLVVVNTTRITSAPITLGTPVHIAVERVDGVTSLYINGVRSGDTYTDTNNYIARQTRPDLFTDGTSESSESLIGNMQFIRVTKDYPRYSANFSPGPTAIFDTVGINQTFLPYNSV
jgi:hypothetical protein